MGKPQIIVVDSIMGTGKTTWAIQEMDANPDESYIYCTPFLDEIERIKESCKRKFFDPKKINGRKSEGFNYLLMSGRDIALTHSAFSNSNNETLEHLKNGNYTLILDEVLDILVNFNDIAGKDISKGDVRLLLNEQFIKVDNYGKVNWIKESYPDSKYSDVERLAKQGHLFYLDNTLLVWQFPPEIFAAFDKVYILTYLFEGSLLKPYFEYHGFLYTIQSVRKNHSGRHELIAYSDYKAERENLKELININHDAKLNNYKNGSLSKTWFAKADKPTLKTLQKNLYNYFHNIKKSDSSNNMWTCPTDRKKDLKGKGYTVVRLTTKEENNLPQNEMEDFKKRLSCFVPCNARATNIYRDRSVLVYAINMYCNPYVKRYFNNKNSIDGTNISVSEDYFALSCLLQWIWRSQIRDGKPIDIYIPSTRMRTLLIDWLNGKM